MRNLPMALKYRPRNFTDVVGQSSAVTVMRKLVSRPEIRVIMLSGQHGIGKCVTGGSRVLTNNGWESLKSFHFGEPADSSREISLQVASFPRWTEATKFYYGGDHREVVKIDLEDGTSLSGLPVHPIMTYDMKGFSYRTLGEIMTDTSDYYVPLIGSETTNWFDSVKLDSEKYLLGLAFSGHYENEEFCMEGRLDRLHYIIHDLDVADARISKVNGSRYSLRSKRLYGMFTGMGLTDRSKIGSYAYSPGEDALYRTSPIGQWSFLAGYYDGKVSNPYSIRDYNKSFVKVLKAFLLTFGIHSVIRKSPGFSGWMLDLEPYSFWRSGLTFGNNFVWGRLPEKVEDLDEWVSTIPSSVITGQMMEKYSFIPPTTARVVSKITIHKAIALNSHLMTPEDVFAIDLLLRMNFVKVRGVAAVKPEPVYDLTAPETQCFITDGVISHNTTLARIYAKAANCTNPSAGDPCDECDSCKAANESRHPDFSERDMGSSGLVEHVRKLQEEINYKPAWKMKVFILDEAHSITKEAGNALLKTLEEPPAMAGFVLCTTEPKRVPYTITSRCLPVELDPVQYDLVADRLIQVGKLEGVGVSGEAAMAIARNTHGSLRDALMILERVSILGEGVVDLKVLGNEQWFISRSHIVMFVKALVNKDQQKYNEVLKKLTGRNSHVSLVQGALEIVCDSVMQKGEITDKARKLVDSMWRAYIRLKRLADPSVAMKGLWVDTTD